MSNKMLVTVKLDQRLKMSQQLRQAISLLHYPTIELKQFIQQSLEMNPLLELDETDLFEAEEESETSLEIDNQNNDSFDVSDHAVNLARRNTNYQDESTLDNYSIPKSLRTHLLEQTLLCQFNPVEQLIAEAIIDAIDEKGYLTMSLAEIIKTVSDDYALDHEMMKRVLNKVQTFDPIGVATEGIKECLLVQLHALPNKNHTWEIACRIVCDHLDKLSLSNTKNIIKQINITMNEYNDAMALIRTLNPNPGAHFINETNYNIEPELFVKKIKNTWCVFLSDSVLTHLKINNQYQALIRQNKKHGSYEGMKKELEEARWLLKGLKRRNETLLLVGKHIIDAQVDFLDQGLQAMKSMTISDVAEALNLHESTISRITNGKYIATPRGVLELKYFFPSHVSTETGHTRSSLAVKELIKEMIAEAAGVSRLSDEEISVKLQAKGIQIARRTVAKYRESLKIRASYQRDLPAHKVTVDEESVI